MILEPATSVAKPTLIIVEPASFLDPAIIDVEPAVIFVEPGYGREDLTGKTCFSMSVDLAGQKLT